MSACLPIKRTAFIFEQLLSGEHFFLETTGSSEWEAETSSDGAILCSQILKVCSHH